MIVLDKELRPETDENGGSLSFLLIFWIQEIKELF